MSEAALQKLVAAKPVEATLVFQATVEDVVKHIISTHPARKTNHLICGSDEGIKDAHKPGALGVSQATSTHLTAPASACRWSTTSSASL